MAAYDSAVFPLLGARASLMGSALEVSRSGGLPLRPSGPAPGCAGPAPGARRVGDLADSVRRVTAAHLGKMLVTYTLAAIQVRQTDADLHEEARRLDNSVAVGKRRWQTFANLVADAPEKEVTCPVTVATDVKICVTSLLLGVTDVVRAAGRPPAAEDPLEWLAGHQWREAGILRLMLDATARMKRLLAADPLGRDLLNPAAVRLRLEALLRGSLPKVAGQKPQLDPLHLALARLILDFLRVLGWFAGCLAYEHEHLTLNRCTFFGIMSGLEAVLPEGSAPAAGGVVRLLREQVASWDRALARSKKLAPKAQSKAPAKKPAAPARAAKKEGPREAALLASAVSPLPSAVSPLPSAVSPLPSAVSPLPSAVSPLPSAVVASATADPPADAPAATDPAPESAPPASEPALDATDSQGSADEHVAASPETSGEDGEGGDDGESAEGGDETDDSDYDSGESDSGESGSEESDSEDSEMASGDEEIAAQGRFLVPVVPDTPLAKPAAPTPAPAAAKSAPSSAKKPALVAAKPTPAAAKPAASSAKPAAAKPAAGAKTTPAKAFVAKNSASLVAAREKDSLNAVHLLYEDLGL